MDFHIQKKHRQASELATEVIFHKIKSLVDVN